jgi:Flp pilus assembly protein protease CpaA
MDAAGLLHRIQFDLLVHGEQYKLYVKAATIVVLLYVALTDFRTSRIPNDSVLLLLILYVVYAFVARSRIEIVEDVVLGAIMFGVLLLFYTRRVLGGGDVKLMSVVCLWVGVHCAVLFSILLLLLVGLHVVAVTIGWVPGRTIADRQVIPYAPSVAGALIGTLLLGCG